MASEEKTKTRKRSREVQEPKRKRVRSRKKKKKSRIISFSRCVPGCLLKVSDYMGIKTVSEKMKDVEKKKLRLRKGCEDFREDFGCKNSVGSLCQV